MKKKWWLWFLAPPAMVLFAWIFGEVVMHLWNWLMPVLFKLPLIGFWQALGLLVLSRILFGGFNNHGNQRGNSRRPSAERWGRMTPEEREKFREGMRARCGGFGEPSGEGAETV